MSLQAKYKTFADTIALTRLSNPYKEAREKDDLITEKVQVAFEDKGYEVLPPFIQGSLKSHTGVIPINGEDYDIDRAIAITKKTSPENPVEPKKVLKKVLTEHGFSNPKIKKPCVTADYSSKPLHIDFPVYRVDSWDNYQLAVGKENSDENNRDWEDADPIGLNDWVTSNKNHQGFYKLTPEEKKQFYRIVRFLKRWRDVQYKSKPQRDKIYSIALTIMAKKSFCPNVSDEGTPDDHAALKDTLEKITPFGNFFSKNWDDSVDLTVDLPVTPYADVFKGNGSSVANVLRNRFVALSNALLDVDDEPSEKEQCIILRKQFGTDFPEGKDNGTSNNSRTRKSKPGLVGVSSGA